jgi:hypothetical protein
MSQRFTIEVSEAELEVVRLALGRMLEPKPVRARKTAAPVITAPVFATGDDRLDVFMRDHWRPSDAAAAAKRAAAGIPAPAKFPFGLKRMTDNQRKEALRFSDMAVKAWQRLGHEVIVDRLEGQSTPYPAVDGHNVRVLPLGASA